MKRSRLIAAFCLLSAFLISACGGVDGGGGGTTVTPYSTTVVNDFIALLNSSNLSSRAISVKLSSTQISYIRSTAIARISTDGLTNSTDVSKILGSMIDGAGTAIETINSTADATGVLAIAARSAVMTIDSASTTQLAGSSAQDVVARITTSTVKKVSDVASDSMALSIKAEIVSEAVSAIGSTTTLKTSTTLVAAIVTSVVTQESAVGSDSVRAVLAAATTAAYGLANAPATTAASLAIAATTAIATVAQNNSSVQSTVTALYAAVAVSISENAPNSDVANLSTTITTAVSDAGGSASDIPSNLDTIISEMAPTAKASASPTGLTAAGTITLSSSGSTAGSPYSAFTYSWACVFGHGPTVAPNGTIEFLTPSSSGSYVYRLTVQNAGGNKIDTADVSITVAIPEPTTHSIAQAISYIEAGDYDAAKAELLAVSVSSSAEAGQAKLWKTFLDLASVAVNKDIVSLAQDNFGFVGYPNTLKTLFSDAWFSKQWYGSRQGFVKYGTVAQAKAAKLYEFYVPFTESSSTSDGFIWGYSLNSDNASSGVWSYFAAWSDSSTQLARVDYYDSSEQYTVSGSSSIALPPDTSTAYVKYDNITDLANPASMLPAISAPSWASSLVKYQGNSLSAYPLYIIANVIDRNPSGLNAMVDKVLSGAFGSDFDSVVAAIKDMPSSLSITIPGSMTENDDFDLAISKDELLAYAGSLEILKGYFQYIASYNFNTDLSAFKIDELFGGLSTNIGSYGDDLPSYALTIMNAYPKGILGTGILANRSQATRNASRASIVQGVTDIYTAGTALSAKLKDGSYDTLLTMAHSKMTGEDLAGIIDGYLPSAKALYEAIADSAKSVSVSISDTETVTATPGAIFDGAFFSPANLFELQGVEKIKLYFWTGTEDYHEGWTYTGLVDDQATLTGTATNDTYRGFAMKLNLTNLAKAYPGIGDLLDSSPDMNPLGVAGAFPVGSFGTDWSGDDGTHTVTYDPFDPVSIQVRTMKWLCGYGVPGN